MTNSIYLLRHAETSIDLTKPARDWSLTEAGRISTVELSKSQVFSKMEGIIHSSENKARETADIIADELQVQTYELPELDELRRDHTTQLTNEEYRARVLQTLTNWEKPAPEWESGEDALDRFLEGIRRINLMFDNKDILVVSHGIVLTLYFSALTHFWNIAYERWAQVKFLSWGLVRGDRVLIDIV